MVETQKQKERAIKSQRFFLFLSDISETRLGRPKGQRQFDFFKLIEALTGRKDDAPQAAILA